MGLAGGICFPQITQISADKFLLQQSAQSVGNISSQKQNVHSGINRKDQTWGGGVAGKVQRDSGRISF
jgi:hypothetical protein